ncbi:MAG: YraN family protein [Clostridiaceae bacterium]
MKNKRSIGSAGEDYAGEYLKKKGYVILERNFFTRTGEIDIIALKNHVLIFVEVKTRFNSRCGTGEESINYIKKERCIKSAQYYIHKNNLYNYNVRFDAVCISIDIDKNEKSIRHYEDAFRL